MPLYNQLKEYRSKLGINQTDLGKMAGVSRQTISLIERGDYSPSVTLALKLAKICEVKVEDIFQYEEERKTGEQTKFLRKVDETDADLSGNRRSLRFFCRNFYDVRSEKWHE